MKKTYLLIIVILLFLNSVGKSQIQKQEQTMWCWASCIQSALYKGGVYQTQSQVVARLTGSPQNRPANSNEVIYILNSYNFTAWSVQYPANPQQLYNTLSSGWKLIAFVNPMNNPNVGHFILLQGISPNGLIIVSDPATGFTYEQNIQQLYYGWKWSTSVVVGKPF